MAQIHTVCTNGHEIRSYVKPDFCPVYVKGSPCKGEIISAGTKQGKEILELGPVSKRKKVDTKTA